MASGDDEPSKPKMQKIDDSSDDIFLTFFWKHNGYDAFMSAFQKLLTNAENAFLPAVIGSCDAASMPSRYGRSFSECECIANVDVYKPFPFGAFFRGGVAIYDSLRRKEIPPESDATLKRVARELLTYVIEGEEWHKELINIREDMYIRSDTQVMVTLVEHFFKPLSLCKGYTMGEHTRKNDMICRCGQCKPTNLRFDDTSIGNYEVWHGSLDVLFDSGDIAVKVPPINEEDEDADGHCEELEKLESVDNIRPRSQVIAQTIVFSCLQKQRQPFSKHFLTPCIIADNCLFKIFCYDAENDILLESKPLEFAFTEFKPLCLQSAIAAWLVVNHKVLCTGVYKECIEKAPKSNFKTLVKDSISIYENELLLRNVEARDEKVKKKPFTNWAALAALDDTFYWPESVPEGITFPLTRRRNDKTNPA